MVKIILLYDGIPDKHKFIQYIVCRPNKRVYGDTRAVIYTNDNGRVNEIELDSDQIWNMAYHSGVV